MSKGSDKRPPSPEIPLEVIGLRWDLAFGDKEAKEKAKLELIKLGIINE
jgi:hypothetical protein